MRTLFLAFLFLVSTLSTITAQNISPEDLQIKVDLVYLASDYLQGRGTGTEGERLAAEYIAARFDEIGLAAAGNNDTYFQAFKVMPQSHPHAHADQDEELTGINVIGYLDNGSPYTVVIGAHYDHLGMGGMGSRAPGKEAIHNGADDNASGTAALLYLAEQLKRNKQQYKQNNYLFIAFSGEEMGLYGSKFYVNNPAISLRTVSYMLNMDMVGRLNEERVLVVNGVGTSSRWEEAINAANTTKLTLNTTDSGVGASDHTSFYLKGIPVLHLFSGSHQDYHTPDDDAALINFEGIREISDYMLSIIEQLKDIKKLDFVKTQDDSQTRRPARFKVTMGVMPDYTFTGEGMRIDAVIEDRPAANAGLKDGDIVLQIGTLEITDIYKYMEALGKHKKGETVNVKVKREDKLIETKLTF